MSFEIPFVWSRVQINLRVKSVNTIISSCDETCEANSVDGIMREAEQGA